MRDLNSQEPTPGGAPRVGVCVLSYNSRQAIGACLRALRGALAGVPYRLVVVDNRSLDKTADFVRREFPGVMLVEAPGNLGYARGNNLGAERLLEFGDVTHLAFVNPDVEVLADTFPRMQAAIVGHPRGGCAGGVADKDGHAWPEAFRNRPTMAQKLILSGILRYLPVFGRLLSGAVRRMQARYYIAADRLRPGSPIHAFSGACFMVRADAFRAAGGMDPDTFLFQEEFILSERLRRAGYEAVAAPDARYLHSGGHSVGRRPVRSFWAFARSEQILIRRYYGWGRVTAWAFYIYRAVECALFGAVMFLARGRRRPEDA